jgi:NAD+ diphosphatase
VIEPFPAPAGAILDRAAHRRTDPEWLASAWKRARILMVSGSSLYTEHALVDAAGNLVFVDANDPVAAATDPQQRFFLGVDEDDTPYFAAVGELPERPGTRAITTRQVGHSLPARDGGILVTAIALVNWHARHPHSPETGQALEIREGGWSRVDADGRQQWPRTDPAVIMLVHDDVAGDAGRCLLGNNAAWAPQPGQVRRYSCLAGFVEPGESAEAAVEREVFEEVGVRVRDVRYASSQPWPYPGSLMLGFYAIADPEAALHLDPTEIAAARWFTRVEIRAALAAMDTDGGTKVEPGLPMASSIAYRLVRGWVEAGERGGVAG